MSDPLILNAVLRGQLGGHTAAWRVSSARIAENTSLDYWVGLARTLEQARFSTLFLADTISLPDDAASPLQWPLDPLVLIAALGARTEHIGLVATHSTTFNDPYTTARQLASIDHLTAGRAGWNVVTSLSPDSATNFTRGDLPEHDLRYRMAREYVDVVIELLHAWESDALIADRESGRLLRRESVRSINHQGQYQTVRGPLTTTRSPQIVPLIAQAGGSPAGIELAGAVADIVYARQIDLDAAVAYRNAVRDSAQRQGRSGDAVKILPGVVPVVAASRAAAQERLEQLRSSDAVARRNHGYATPDFSAESSGHRVLPGTALEIADDLERWLDAGAIDGVSVHVNVLPDDLDAFVEQVVPLLQQRGLVAPQYARGTLRDRLGLPAPVADESSFTPHYTDAEDSEQVLSDAVGPVSAR